MGCLYHCTIHCSTLPAHQRTPLFPRPQAKNTLNEKRISGTDKFSCKIVSLDFKVQVEGRWRIEDLANGLYEVNYCTPLPGRYHVHVYHADLGASEPGQIRGSPFTIECSDPWTKHRTMGACPAKRKGMALLPMGDELVAWGGDKSGLSTVSISGNDWRWAPAAAVKEDPEAEGEPVVPEDRVNASISLKKGKMLMHGGASLKDNQDIADFCILKKTEEGWVWSIVSENASYLRRPKAEPEPKEAPVEEAPAAAAPAEGEEGEAEEAAAPAEAEEPEAAAEEEEEEPAAAPMPDEDAEPEPFIPRNSASTWVVGNDFYVFGGDNDGELLQEFCVMDMTNKESCEWLEPEIDGPMPEARKGAGAAASGKRVVLFGGIGMDEENNPTTLTDCFLFEVTGPATVKSTKLKFSGSVPPPRSYPIFLKIKPEQLFMYGGFAADGKPLNDGWLLDMTTMTWSCMYFGHTDLVLPTGSVACLMPSEDTYRLVVLNSGAGSPKIDLAQSIDLFAAKESFKFLDKMKNTVDELLGDLDKWVRSMAAAFKLAEKPEELAKNFDNVLKVMSALLQVKNKKLETDLTIDQMYEVLQTLSETGVSKSVPGGQQLIGWPSKQSVCRHNGAAPGKEREGKLCVSHYSLPNTPSAALPEVLPQAMCVASLDTRHRPLLPSGLASLP